MTAVTVPGSETEKGSVTCSPIPSPLGVTVGTVSPAAGTSMTGAVGVDDEVDGRELPLPALSRR